MSRIKVERGPSWVFLDLGGQSSMVVESNLLYFELQLSTLLDWPSE
jgi:hypothetical protein